LRVLGKPDVTGALMDDLGPDKGVITDVKKSVGTS